MPYLDDETSQAGDLISPAEVQKHIAETQDNDGLFLWLSGNLEIGVSSAGAPGKLFVDDAFLEVAVDISGSEPMEPTVMHLSRQKVLDILSILGIGVKNVKSSGRTDSVKE